MKLVIDDIKTAAISAYRKATLKPLVDYIQAKIDDGSELNLNFICTHNSRRSQFAQVWSAAAADHFNVNANSFSGGIEVTACNERTIASLKRSGFQAKATGSENPHYELSADFIKRPLTVFSKMFDDKTNPTTNFAAIITCSHADENCPFIPGADERIPVRYNDPKGFDNTDMEEQIYDERSNEIATELFYVFSQIK
ncbi:MAG: protein-tyrosine-phosphatase [Flavobacteriales bacterium]|nr:protein-tyrosine-phosphatase [Flavobacteriales bacterium]